MTSNYASALGEKIGNVFENAITDLLRYKIEEKHATMSPERLADDNGIPYKIDQVVRDSNNNVQMLMEFKFIRYTKHNRDKASWIEGTHGKLRITHPTIKLCIAVLGGNWSNPSLKMLRSGNIQVVRIPFDVFVRVYKKYGVNIDWGEQDDNMKKDAYDAEQKLTTEEKIKIGNEIIHDVKDDLLSYIYTQLD